MILICAAALLPAACFFYVILIHDALNPRHVYMVYKYETTMTWAGGPDVELSPKSMGKLNSELDEIIIRETWRKDLHYPVVSLGKKWVEVIYLGEQDVPGTLRETLDTYIPKRLPELALEQTNLNQAR